MKQQENWKQWQSEQSSPKFWPKSCQAETTVLDPIPHISAHHLQASQPAPGQAWHCGLPGHASLFMDIGLAFLNKRCFHARSIGWLKPWLSCFSARRCFCIIVTWGSKAIKAPIIRVFENLIYYVNCTYQALRRDAKVSLHSKNNINITLVNWGLSAI